MDSTHIDGNHNNNNGMEDEFDNCIDDKVCVYETLISGGFINKDLYDTDNKHRTIHNYVTVNDETVVGFINEKPRDTEFKQESIHKYIRIKDENIDDLTVIIPETEHITDCTDDKVCLNEAVIRGGNIKQEQHGMKDEQGSILNYLSIKDENMDDLTVVAQETKPMTDCIDNKICIYETIISGGYIKEEPCDIEKSENIHNNIKMNDCEECGVEYDLYCLKCPMLVRIFDSNNPDGKDNTLGWTLPKGIIDICQTPSGVVIVAFRTIPKGVVFGPFKGLVSTKGGTVSKWKLRNKKLVCTKDPRCLNWMQYIRIADQDSQQNLVPFQYKGGLYYRSDCHINVGDELLVCWDSDSKESKIKDMGHSYWKPPVYESLDDSYACTFCCVGYKSISHLKAHNSTCIEKRNEKDFCGDIIQCGICNVYLDKKEYSDYHMDRCYKTNGKNCRRNRKGALRYRIHNDNRPFSCTLCSYKAMSKSKLKLHIASHNGDKPFACTLCSYKATTKGNLKQHIATHNGNKPFACTLCPYKAKKAWTLKQHFAVHDSDKPLGCTFCPYKTTRKIYLKQHMAVHNDDRPFPCTICPYKATTKSILKKHIAIHIDDRSFVCTHCPYKTTRKSDLKQHVAIHNKDKPFACTLCSYKAKTNANLKRHVVSHNR